MNIDINSLFLEFYFKSSYYESLFYDTIKMIRKRRKKIYYIIKLIQEVKILYHVLKNLSLNTLKNILYFLFYPNCDKILNTEIKSHKEK